MQSIGRVTSGARTGTTRGAARGGSGFSIAAGGGTAAREAMAAAEVVAPGLGLLALQEAGSGAERDAAAYQRASAILEELNGLQSALLGGGGDDPGRLERLAALEIGRGWRRSHPARGGSGYRFARQGRTGAAGLHKLATAS